MSSNEVVRENIRRVMRATGTTQDRLAELLGVTGPSISQMLSGRTGLTLDRLDRVAETLGVEPRDLMKPIRTKVQKVST